MKLTVYFFGVMFLSGLCTPAQAQEQPQQQYDLTSWVEDVKATGWETAVVFAGVNATGYGSWEWGSSKTFSWKQEGWFEADTYLGGSDKLGHAYSSYALTNLLFDHLVVEGRSPERAVLSAMLTTQAIMTYLELRDGYSGQFGFSPEDIVTNLLGSGFAYLRATRPGLRELIDFRLEYEFSGYEAYKARSNYLLALKLNGIESLRNSSLRFMELHLGYYTRGYTSAQREDGFAPSRYIFVGVGLNLSELFLGRRQSQEPPSKRNGRLIFEHIQLPYTAIKAAREL